MQQGLTFHKFQKLLRVSKVFHNSVLLERLVLYAPHIHIQAYNRINKKQSPNCNIRTKQGHKTVLLFHMIQWI
jgi:hypothetical protein